MAESTWKIMAGVPSVEMARVGALDDMLAALDAAYWPRAIARHRDVLTRRAHRALDRGDIALALTLLDRCWVSYGIAAVCTWMAGPGRGCEGSADGWCPVCSSLWLGAT